MFHRATPPPLTHGIIFPAPAAARGARGPAPPMGRLRQRQHSGAQRVRSTTLLLALLLSAGVSTGRGRKKARGSSSSGSGSGSHPPPDRSTWQRLRPVMEQADQLDQSGRKAEAVERYREALELWPDFDHGHYNLALCLQESGRLGEAQHHFDRTLELLPPPASPEDRRKRFDVLSRYGKLSTSIALGGGLDSAAVVEGVQLPARQSQALKAAARLLREAVRLEPTDGASRLALSQTLSVRGRGAEALEQLRQSVALSPADPAAMVELALGLHRHAAEKKTGKENLRVSGGGDGGASEELQATLDHAFRAAEPPKGVAKAVAAQFHSQLGMKLRRELPHAARRHFERALSLDPGHASASTSYYHLGEPLERSTPQHRFITTEFPVSDDIKTLPRVDVCLLSTFC